MLFKIYGEILYGPRHTKDEMKNAVENITVEVNDFIKGVRALANLPDDIRHEILENRPEKVKNLIIHCLHYRTGEKIAEYMNQTLFNDKKYIQNNNISNIEKVVLNTLIAVYGYKKVHIKEVI